MGTWVAGGSLNIARESMPAITLQDGRVLVVSGYTGSNTFTPTCEISTTNGSSWSFTGSLSHTTSYNRLILLPSGKVLSIGGSDDNGVHLALGYTDEYDPNTELWTPKSNMIEGRFGFGCWLLPDNTVLVAGGWSGSGTITSSEIYDPAMDTWTAAGSLNIARYFGGDNMSGSGKPVMIAGATSQTTVTSTIEVYDIMGDTWNLQSSTLPAGFGTNCPQNSPSITLQDGTILWFGCDILAAIVSGGTLASDKSGVFDADADTFTAKGDLSAPTTDANPFLLANGDVLIAGGFDGIDVHPTYDTSQLYNASTGLWSEDSNLPNVLLAGNWHSAVLLEDTKPFTIGGVSNVSPTTETYIYAPPVIPDSTGGSPNPASNMNFFL